MNYYTSKYGKVEARNYLDLSLLFRYFETKEVIDMSTTLQEAVELIKDFKRPIKTKINIARDLLGKYKGIVPSEKTSTEIIKELRESLYGKVKE